MVVPSIKFTLLVSSFILLWTGNTKVTSFVTRKTFIFFLSAMGTAIFTELRQMPLLLALKTLLSGYLEHDYTSFIFFGFHYLLFRQQSDSQVSTVFSSQAMRILEH